MYYCNIKYEIRPKSRLYFFYTPFYTARLLNLFTNAERFYIVVFVNDTRARIHLFIAFKDMKTKKRKNSDYIVDNQSKLAVIKKKKRKKKMKKKKKDEETVYVECWIQTSSPRQ